MHRTILFRGTGATLVRLNADRHVCELIEWFRRDDQVFMFIIRHLHDGYEITLAANTPGDQRTVIGNNLSALLALLGIETVFEILKYRGPFEMDYLSVQPHNLAHLGYDNVHVVS